MPHPAPTVYDVATAAGVSTATVSRFFRSPDSVAAATRERVARAVAELGYVPNGLARGLAERQAGAIGLYMFGEYDAEASERDERDSAAAGAVGIAREDAAIPRLYPLYEDEVLRGVELESMIRGYPLTLGWERKSLGGVEIHEIARRTDGLIVLPYVLPAETLEHLARTKPVVQVSRARQHDQPMDAVTVDNELGMRALAEHLIDGHGHREFWFIGATAVFDVRARFDGLNGALASRGLPVLEAPTTQADRQPHLDEAVRALVAARPLPDAVVCATDVIALRVLRTLRALRVDVPGRVALTGFDGLSIGRLSHPTITTVRQPMERLGRTAVELLVSRLEGRTEPRHAVLPLDLAIRRSCGCPG